MSDLSEFDLDQSGLWLSELDSQSSHTVARREQLDSGLKDFDKDHLFFKAIDIDLQECTNYSHAHLLMSLQQVARVVNDVLPL
jgi:predicted lipid carrier protein YhbT